MRIVYFVAPLASLLAAVPLAAQTAPPPAERKEAELERLLHKAVTAELPKLYEDDSAWGQTIPIPERLRLPRLRRTVVEVDGRPELPHGTWRKVRLWVEDAGRDLTIRVRDFKALDAKTYRLAVEADVALRSETDVQQWQKGLLLANLTARADVGLSVLVECEVTAGLDLKKRPPGLSVEPRVEGLKLGLRDFDLKRVTFQRAGVAVEGEAVEGAGEEFKGALQEMLRGLEPGAKKRAGESIAKGLKEGKGPLTGGALIKAAMPLLANPEKPKEK
jgi:hypothetical protein